MYRNIRSTGPDDTEGPDEDDDAISVGDVRTAFLFGKEYGPDDIQSGVPDRNAFHFGTLFLIEEKSTKY